MRQTNKCLTTDAADTRKSEAEWICLRVQQILELGEQKESNMENEKLTIDDLGYVEEMRQRLGLEKDDTSRDNDILAMTPFERVGLIAGWYHGYNSWAETYKGYFKSQGLFLTTNKEADGVIA